MEVEPELIERCIRGEREAFRTLVEGHQRYAYALAFRVVGDPRDAQEIVQDAFLRVWRHLPSYDPRMKFTTWLYRIVINLAYDRSRAKNRHRLLPLDDAEEYAEAGCPEAETRLIDQDLAARIREIADGLPRTQRLVFTLRDLQDCTVRETAEILATTEGAVKTNLCLARRAVRAAMRELEPRERL